MAYILSIKNISLSFEKTIIDKFSVDVAFGARIALIGANGSGKSSLLSLLSGQSQPDEGTIRCHAHIGHVPQILPKKLDLSGGEIFQQAFGRSLQQQPDLLLLDEPTNHLDAVNCKSLMRFIARYHGALIIATHDLELLGLGGFDEIWHFERGKITVFQGSFLDYQEKRRHEQQHHADQIALINKEKKRLHQERMKEQKRAATNAQMGKKHIAQRKWPTIVSPTKVARGCQTADKRLASMSERRQELLEEQQQHAIDKEIIPTFSLTTRARLGKNVLSLSGVNVRYHNEERWVIKSFSLTLGPAEKAALWGPTASGKSTLFRALLKDPRLEVSGELHGPEPENIGYFDQHYQQIDPELTVLEHLKEICPQWDHNECRQHLQTYLFRENSQVHQKAVSLSGGEKARLMLCMIAAKPPHLLLLDEINNNIDTQTRQQLIDVLSRYPGALLVISHDKKFLEQIGIEQYYDMTYQ